MPCTPCKCSGSPAAHTRTFAWPRARGLMHGARSQHGERGCAFGRRSPTHLDRLRSLLLHVPRSRSPSEHWVEDQPLLRRTRARVAFVREAAQHMGRTCGAWSKWTVQVTRPCSTTRSRAVGGEPQVDQCGTPSMVDTGQRETKSQLLQGKRCTAAVDETTVGAWICEMGRGGWRHQKA